MTRVEFFFNVENKPQKVAELAASAVRKNRRLVVFAPDIDAVRAYEAALWTMFPLSFLPHCRAESPLANVTPIIVAWRDDQWVHDDVLINLQTQYPPFFSRFRRLIEIVGIEGADKMQARERYRFYRDRGYEIKSFDAMGASL